MYSKLTLNKLRNSPTTVRLSNGKGLRFSQVQNSIEKNKTNKRLLHNKIITSSLNDFRIYCTESLRIGLYDSNKHCYYVELTHLWSWGHI